MRKNTAPRRNLEIGAIIVLILLMVCMLFQVLLFFNSQKTPKMTQFPNKTHSETLTFVMNYNCAPYSFQDEAGQYLGHDVELVYALGEKMQTNVNIQFKSWAVAKEDVMNGVGDVLMGIEYNDAEKRNFDLSIPLSEDKFVVFGKKNISTINELYGSKFAVIASNLSYSKVLNTYNLEGNVKTYSSYMEAFESVRDGKNDYVIARYSVGQRVRVAIDDKSIQPSKINLIYTHMSLGVKKGNEALKNRLDVAITELAKDGTLEKLSKKWTGSYVKAVSFSEFFMANKNAVMITILAECIVAIAAILTFNRMMLTMTLKQRKNMLQELEHERLFAEATKSLYDNIYEVDITRNRAANKRTERYFKSIMSATGGATEELKYDVAVREIAKAQLKKEYVQDYINIFAPEKVIEAYEKGFNRLSYDFMATDNGVNYHWMRVHGRLFFWKSDNSLRMIIYRQNIDSEKRQALELLEKVKRDPMTNLYNKETTEKLITKSVETRFDKEHKDAFLIIDMDDFKYANDHFGHAFGDYLIRNFAAYLKQQFRGNDIVGRIGGDEFVVYLENIPGEAWLSQKLEELLTGLKGNAELEMKDYRVTASIGVAFRSESTGKFETLYRSADRALYQTKSRGKNGYTIFRPEFIKAVGESSDMHLE